MEQNKPKFKVGDYVTIVYYIPEDNKYGPLNDCYYGKIVKFIKNTKLFEYDIIAEISNGTMFIQKQGCKLADDSHVIEINGRFSLNRFEEFINIAKNKYHNDKTISNRT